MMDIPQDAVELANLSRRLLRCAADANIVGSDPKDELAINPIYADLARRELRLRQQRGSLFNTQIFGEPAWEILLAAFVARYDGVPLMTTAACAHANVPQTTGLRYVRHLIELQLINKAKNSPDGRVSNLEITDIGLAKINRYYELLIIRE